MSRLKTTLSAKRRISFHPTRLALPLLFRNTHLLPTTLASSAVPDVQHSSCRIRLVRAGRRKPMPSDDGSPIPTTFPSLGPNNPSSPIPPGPPPRQDILTSFPLFRASEWYSLPLRSWIRARTASNTTDGTPVWSTRASSLCARLAAALPVGGVGSVHLYLHCLDRELVTPREQLPCLARLLVASIIFIGGLTPLAGNISISTSAQCSPPQSTTRVDVDEIGNSL